MSIETGEERQPLMEHQDIEMQNDKSEKGKGKKNMITFALAALAALLIGGGAYLCYNAYSGTTKTPAVKEPTAEEKAAELKRKAEEAEAEKKRIEEENRIKEEERIAEEKRKAEQKTIADFEKLTKEILEFKDEDKVGKKEEITQKFTDLKELLSEENIKIIEQDKLNGTLTQQYRKFEKYLEVLTKVNEAAKTFDLAKKFDQDEYVKQVETRCTELDAELESEIDEKVKNFNQNKGLKGFKSHRTEAHRKSENTKKVNSMLEKTSKRTVLKGWSNNYKKKSLKFLQYSYELKLANRKLKKAEKEGTEEEKAALNQEIQKLEKQISELNMEEVEAKKLNKAVKTEFDDIIAYANPEGKDNPRAEENIEGRLKVIILDYQIRIKQMERSDMEKKKVNRVKELESKREAASREGNNALVAELLKQIDKEEDKFATESAKIGADVFQLTNTRNMQTHHAKRNANLEG